MLQHEKEEADKLLDQPLRFERGVAFLALLMQRWGEDRDTKSCWPWSCFESTAFYAKNVLAVDAVHWELLRHQRFLWALELQVLYVRPNRLASLSYSFIDWTTMEEDEPNVP